MWHLYIFMGALTAGIVLKIVHPLLGRGRHRHSDAQTKADRYLAGGLVFFLPLVSLGVYLALGSPDMKGAAVLMTRDRSVWQAVGDHHAALLAVRPMQRLVEGNPQDIGALMTLGQINHRLKKYDAAILYFRRALEVAQTEEGWQIPNIDANEDGYALSRPRQ